MIRTAVFIIICCFFVLTSSMTSTVHAKATANSKEDILHDKLFIPAQLIPNYRNKLRNIISILNSYAKGKNEDFIIIARNGLELTKKGIWEIQLSELHQAYKKGFIKSGEDEIPVMGTPMRRYLMDIDAVIVDGLYCGKASIDKETRQHLKDYGLPILAIEHCETRQEVKKAIITSARSNILTYADTDKKKKFDSIPKERPFGENSNNITSLKQAKNILITLDSKQFPSKSEWILALGNTNHDIVIIDAFHKGNKSLTAKDVKSIKYKKLGARRIVLARLNITTAEDNRYYWKESWQIGRPSWLRTPNQNNLNGVITEYWNPAWTEIIGNYFKGIIDLGFDGIMIEGLENHKYFERLTPIE